jgi:two-component system response regulator
MLSPTEPLKPIEILLVEDSETDVLMTRIALESAKMAHHLHVVDNGVDAIAYLRRLDPYSTAPPVHLVLLDLNLPKKNGLEVLAEIKADAQLKNIPVVVLTSSTAEEDILRAYSLHANCYVAKSMDFTGLAEVIRAIAHFWCTIATLPPR